MIKKICVLVQNIISKHNKTRDHKMNLLMITDGKRYMALYRNKKHISIIKGCFIKA